MSPGFAGGRNGAQFVLTCGAGEGNRTLVSSLEGWCSTIELHPHVKESIAHLSRACKGKFSKEALEKALELIYNT